MLIVGAMAVVRCSERNGAKRPWLLQLLARRQAKVAAVALRNKNARTILAMKGQRRTLPRTADWVRNMARRPRLTRLERANRSCCSRPVETAGLGKTRNAQAPRVRAIDRAPNRANGIAASGTQRRTNRSDTWPHQPAMQSHCSSLPAVSRPHIGVSGPSPSERQRDRIRSGFDAA